MFSVQSFVFCLLLTLTSALRLVNSAGAYENSRSSAYRDVRLRKEFTSMTYDERRRFVRAYKFVSTHQPFKRRFHYLVGLHQTLFEKVHVEKQFFPWHRWYLLQFENLLRRADSRVTLPYWDWSVRGQKPWETGKKKVWNNYPWGLGGNGTGIFSCVENGPFRKTLWRLAPKSGGGCLRRNFMGRLPSVVAIHLTMRFTVAQFKQFESVIRNFYHNELHCCIQGTMELTSASNTPEFLLHHAFMDKLWYDWQKKGPEYKFKLDDNLNSKLRGSHYRVSDFMDPNNLGYYDTTVHYRDPFPGYKRLHDTLRRLDHETVKMLDSYDNNTLNSCCPKREPYMTKKLDQLDKYKKEIPIEVAMDYGHSADDIEFEENFEF